MDTRKELALEFISRRPAAAARLLEQQPAEQSIKLLSEMPARLIAPVIAAMLPHYASQCLAGFAVEHAAGVIQQLSNHRGASLLRGMSQKRRDKILDQLSQMQASSLRFLLTYNNNLVGAWVDQHAFTLPPDIDVAQARQRLQQWQSFDAHRLFVIGHHNHLHGALAITRLLQADDQTPIRDLIEPVKALRLRHSLFTAEQHKDWFDHIEMPVIGRHDEYIGIITYKVLNRALRSLRQQQTGASVSDEALNTLADVFFNSFSSTWHTWVDLMSLPLEPQGDEREQLTGRNRNS